MRRALSEPSIGSITTRRRRAAVAEGDLAALLGDRGELGARLVQRLELGEDDVLRLAVDHQAAVAALADAGVLGAGRDRRWCARTARCWAATIRRQAPSQSSVGNPAASDRAIPAMLEAVGECPPTVDTPTAAQRRVAAHERRPLLDRSARPARAAPRRWRCGSRRSSARGVRPERVLVLARSRAARARLRERAEDAARPPARGALDPHLRGGRRGAACASTRSRPGLDPFFTTVGPADRLAILLDRVDELPLRRHEIRGNPAGLLARLLRRIDVLKAEARRATGAARVGGRAQRARRRPRPSASAPSARSSSPSSTRATTGSCARRAASTAATWCSSWPAARQAAPTSPRGRRALPATVLVDELEDAGVAHRRLLDALAAARQRRLRLRSGAGDPALSRRAAPPRWPRSAPSHPEAVGDRSRRVRCAQPGVTRFWRCENERAQAQAVAREVEHLLAAGEVRARAHLRHRRLGLARGPPRRRRARGAQRAVPLRRRRGLLPAAPRSATRSPGCGCSPTPPTPPPSSAR